MKIDLLLQEALQKYIKDHLKSPIDKILLRKNPFPNIDIYEIVSQIKGRNIAEKKMPFLLKKGIIFPPHLNLEQASSEITANFKSQFYRGKSFLDLSCGFGIDAFFISKNFENTHLVEQNTELVEIVQHNWMVFNKVANFYPMRLEDYLQQNKQTFDLIYLDPARRDENHQKKVFLEDLSPNIVLLEEQLLKLAPVVFIKLSPMLDISKLMQSIKHLSRIDIVSVKNEVKELLIHLSGESIAENCPIYCHNLESNEKSICFSGNDNLSEIEYSEVLKYIQIPNASCMKAAQWASIGLQFGIKKLHPNSHIYTSNHWVEDFPGRQMEVVEINKKEIVKKEKYNLIIRNYPLKDTEIKKKYSLIDGGNNYLIFTQSLQKKIILKSR